MVDLQYRGSVYLDNFLTFYFHSDMQRQTLYYTPDSRIISSTLCPRLMNSVIYFV